MTFHGRLIRAFHRSYRHWAPCPIGGLAVARASSTRSSVPLPTGQHIADRVARCFRYPNPMSVIGAFSPAITRKLFTIFYDCFKSFVKWTYGAYGVCVSWYLSRLVQFLPICTKLVFSRIWLFSLPSLQLSQKTLQGDIDRYWWDFFWPKDFTLLNSLSCL